MNRLEISDVLSDLSGRQFVSGNREINSGISSAMRLEEADEDFDHTQTFTCR